MANLALSVAPGYYLEAQSVGWVLSSDVDFVSFNQNGPAPAISKYIAYDTLVPPNPFIAVTQDGTGNVVYDGGFPKFYNALAPALGTPFASLTAQWKYMYNALNFCANPTKVAAGNRKVLVLGDTTAATGPAYPVKGTGPTAFQTAMTNICSIAGYTPTFKDLDDYGGAQLNPTLAELNQYCCVIFFSTAYSQTNADLITNPAITDFVTYRQQGNGMAFITDHGSTPFTDISKVRVHPDGTGFYATANRIIANFGAFFSGVYDRTPVNVGFIRANYGDHPLYAGMTNAEDIAAGGSESKIILPTFQKWTAANIPGLSIANNGVNTVKAIAVLKSGVIELYSFVYVIATGQLLKILDADGVEINSLPASFSNNRTFSVQVVGGGLGTIEGDVLLNSTKVAELAFTDALGSSEAWYAGSSRFVPVKKGDVFNVRITSPFQFSRQLPVNRYQPDPTGSSQLPTLIKQLQADGFSAIQPQLVLKQAVAEMNLNYSHLQNYLHGDSASNLKALRSWLAGTLDLPNQNAYIYPTAVAAADAMSRLTPPSQVTVFNTWDRFANDEFFPGGVGATGEAAAWVWDDAKQAAVMPLNTGAWVGFVSPDATDTYEIDVVIKSDNADDDTNGVLLAFNRVGAVNNRLIFNVNMGGFPTPVTATLMIQAYAPGVTVLAQNAALPQFSNPNFPADGGWRGRSVRVKVVRNGDNFKITTSQWNSLLLDPATTIDYTLPQSGVAAQFRGAKPWGFINISQPASYFNLRSFKGGTLYDIVVDVSTNKVYRYSNGAWAVLPGLKAQDVFGAPRTMVNPETGAQFKLNANGTITAL